MPSQRYHQVSSTVDDEEEDLPQYSTSHSQTYYSGLPTSSPPPALNNIFISAGDEKSVPVQNGSPDNGDVEIEQLDLEAQETDPISVAEQPSKAWQTFETVATLAFAVWFCGLITWVIVKKA